MYRQRFLFAVASLLCIGSALHAQTGAIRGCVKNKLRQPVANAKVELLRASNSPCVTDAAGEFFFSDVPSGNDTIRVVAYGFKNLLLPVDIGSGAEAVLEAVLTGGMHVEEDGYGFIRQPCDTKPGHGTVIVYAADRESKDVLPNAAIVLSSEYEDEIGMTHGWCCSEGNTDSTGRLKICDLQPGSHTIGIQTDGYEHDRYTQIVEADSTYTHRFFLKRQ